MNIFSIDPSINSTGWAYFKKDKLFTWGLIKSNRYKDFDIENLCYKSIYMSYQLEKYIKKFNILKEGTVVIEYPTKFEGYRGIGAKDSGSLNKLCFLCGVLYLKFDPKFIKPYKWKGQLNKKQVENRIIKVYPNMKGKNHNIIDAVGIGYYYINGGLPK